MAKKLLLTTLILLPFLLLPPQFVRSADLDAKETEHTVSCSSDVCLVASSTKELVFEVQLPAYTESQESERNGLVYDTILVSDWDLLAEAGNPQLPTKNVMIGVPPQATMAIEVYDTETRQLAGRYHVAPAPAPTVEQELPASPGETSLRLHYRGAEETAKNAVYAQSTLYPSALARIVDVGFIRHQRVATIALTPFQHNPVSGRIWVTQRFTVKVTFSQDRTTTAEGTSDLEPGGFEDLLERNLLNYGTARQWRGAAAAGYDYQVWDPPLPGYKISVAQDGVYELTYDDLLAAGIPVDDVDPRTFQIFGQGAEIAILVQGEEDGDFGMGDTILFYGLNHQEKYAQYNVYWLTYGSQGGKRMPLRDGSLVGGNPVPVSSPRSVHLEQGGYYYSIADGDDELDRWFWNYVYTPQSLTKSYAFDLPALPMGVYTATLHVALYGGIDDPINPDHHTQVSVNGHLLEDAWWDGQAWRISQLDFPQSYLADGANEIQVKCPNDTGVGYDFVIVDWFTLDYWGGYAADNDQILFGQDVPGTWEYRVTDLSSPDVAVFDITDPLSVTQVVSLTIETGAVTNTVRFRDVLDAEREYLALTPARYLSPVDIVLDSPSDWRASGHGADYIVITHASFYTEALSLADHRATYGLRTAVADIEDIYDEFAFGLVDAKAVRGFLAHAYENWVPPAPAFVVLVGDGTYDPKNYLGIGAQNYVPPYLAYVDPWMGETSADNRYVSISGDDILPDMHIGRLPVNTPAEAAAAIEKTLTYEQSPLPGDWNEVVTFAADNADGAGDFDALSDDLAANYLPAPYRANKIYLGETCPYQSPSVECKQQVLDSINVTGTLLVNYIGHASTRLWAEERLFARQDIPTLVNSGRYPIFLPMSCYDGYYIIPYSGNACSGEVAVRVGNRGAVASWSSAGLGVASGHHYLNRGFFDAVFHDGVQELGPAMLQGKLWVYNSGSDHDLIETYHLFGDPALRLNLLKTNTSITKTARPPGTVQPGDTITYTLTYTNTGPATAFNVVIRDDLPHELITPTVASSGAVITQHIGSRYVWDVDDLPAGQGGTITITAIVSPGLGSVTLTNTATIESSGVENDAADNDDMAALSVVRDIHYTYLPSVFRDYVHAPDLVVEDILATSNSVQVVIRNQGAAPVHNAFWVDVYIDPHTPPTAVNQVWQALSQQGLVWCVRADTLSSLQPGGVVTLTVDDGYYWPLLSHVVWPLPPGTPIYAQVDAANQNTDYGGVLEDHEIRGQAYNNILGPTYSVAAASPALPSFQAERQSGRYDSLPPR